MKPCFTFLAAGVRSVDLYNIVWEAIRQLEMCGFSVIAVTADGASCNRRFFRQHWLPEPGVLVNSVPNRYGYPRSVFFFSDVPHLIKTARNCLSHSYPGSTRRSMMVRRREICKKTLKNFVRSTESTSRGSTSANFTADAEKVLTEVACPYCQNSSLST